MLESGSVENPKVDEAVTENSRFEIRPAALVEGSSEGKFESNRRARKKRMNDGRRAEEMMKELEAWVELGKQAAVTADRTIIGEMQCVMMGMGLRTARIRVWILHPRCYERVTMRSCAWTPDGASTGPPLCDSDIGESGILCQRLSPSGIDL
jgi:hypothetical protein